MHAAFHEGLGARFVAIPKLPKMEAAADAG